MDGGLLQQMGAGYAPVASGRPPAFRTGFEGVPVVGDNPIAGMIGGTYLAGAMGGMGMAPMGLNHGQNTWDVIRARQYMQARQRAMTLAVEADRASALETFRGVAAMTGTRFGAEQRRAAGTIVDGIMPFAPMMAMFNPDLLDAMGGHRGSAVVMADRMMEAGRYRMDAATGRMGMSAESAGFAANRLFDQIYSQDRGAGMRGLTAGQVGGLFQELQARGMVGRDATPLADRQMATLARMPEADRQALMAGRGVAPAGGDFRRLSGDDLDKLSLDEGFANKLRAFDADKVRRSITAYSGAVAAMRDIFGDNGRPNAPMAELVRGLEAMTGGSMASMDPARAAAMVRQTYNLSKSTGVTLDTAMLMQGHFQARAQAAGLEGVFGVQATQSALAFGGAYKALGLGAPTAWGAAGADQIQQMAGNLTVGAAASNMANRLAAVARLGRTVGGFEAGSEAANLLDAVRGGQTTFEGAGGRRSLAMNESEFYRILTSARGAGGRALGVTENDVRELLSQRDENREFAAENNIGNTVFRMQARDQVNPFVADRLRETLANRLGDAGADRGRAGELAKALSRRATDRVMAIDLDDFSDDRRRDGRIAEILDEEIRAEGGGDLLDGMGEGERDAFLRVTAQRFYGRANQAIRNSGLRGLGNLQNVRRVYDPEAIAEAQRNQERQASEAGLQDAMAPLGRGGFGRRLMAAIQSARPDTGIAELIGEAAGGVKAADVREAAVAPIQAVKDKVEAVRALMDQIARTPDGAAKDDLRKRLAEQQRGLAGAADDAAKVLRDQGLLADDRLSAADTREALDLTADAEGAVGDLAGLRGGFGTEVTDAQRAAAQSAWKSRNKTAAEAAAVIIARRTENAGNVTDADADREVALVKSQTGQEVSRDEARRRVSARRRANAHIIDDATVEAGMADRGDLSAAEADAFARVQRQMTPARPTDDAVRKFAQEKGITEEAARRHLTDRLRARRWGITGFDGEPGEIQDYKRSTPGGAAMSDSDALAGVVAARERKAYDVSDAEVDEKIKTSGMDAGNREAARLAVLEDRRKGRAEKFDRYAQTPEGAAARDQLRQQRDAVTSTAERLVTGEDAVKRFGTQAVDWFNRLRDIDQRRRVLALKYTGGDVDRLQMAGASLAAGVGADEARGVREELEGMSAEQRDILGRLHAAHGKSGRQYRLGDEAAARSALGFKPGQKLTDAEAAKVTAERERVGDRQEAARLMGLTDAEAARLAAAPDDQLSEADRKKKADLAARAWDVGRARRLSPTDEAAVRRYAKDEDAVRATADRLGVSPDELRAFADGKGAVKKLTGLGDAERARRDDASKAVAAADRAERAAAARGDREGVQAARADRLRAMAGVQDDAAGRGVEAEDYVRGGKGFTTEAARRQAVEQAARSGKSAEEVKEVARRLGVKDEELRHLTRTVIDPQTRLAAEYKRRATESGLDIVGDIGKAFLGDKFSLDRQDKDVQDFASRVGSTTEGRAWGQHMVRGQRWLSEIAKDGGTDTSALAKGWKEAMAKGTAREREAALKELQTKYKIDTSSETGRRRWDQLTETLDVQSRAGLLDRPGGGRLTVADLSRAYDRLRSGGERAPGDRTPGSGPGGGWDGRISGTLTLIGNNQVTVDARTGGVPGNAAAPT